MIRNLLYSISLHILLALVIYLNFNFEEFIEIKANQPVTVSFVALKAGVLPKINEPLKPEPQITPQPELKPKEKIFEPKKEGGKLEEKEPEPNPDPKKEEKKPEPKKPELKKAEPKKLEFKKEEKLKEEKKVEKKKPEPKSEPKKEEPKAEEKKLEEKKPEEKKIELPPEPKVEPKKEDPKPAENNDTKITTAVKITKNIEKDPSLNLSEREKYNVQLQIKKCYKKAILEAESISNIPINIKLKLNPDGNINPASIKVLNKDDYKSTPQDLEIALKNAKKALNDCGQIRNLPMDKYEIWQEMEITFDPKNQ